MRILIINNTYGFLGGTEKYVRDIKNALKRRGHYVYVVAVEKVGDYNINEENLTFTKELLLDDIGKDIKFILNKTNPDIIFINNFSNAQLIEKLIKIKPVCRFLHDYSPLCLGWSKVIRFTGNICEYPLGPWCIPCALYSHTISYRPKIMLRQIKLKFYEQRVLSKIKNIIVASRYMKECLISNDFEDARIDINPYFINLPDVTDVSYENFILFVGRIWEQKGLQFLIKALAYCDKCINLKIIGDGPYLKTIITQIKNTNLSHRIEILGMLPYEKISEYYKNCLVVVVPSIWPEPFGIVGVESMSFQKPVVAFDVGGIKDWLLNGETGFLVKRGDVRGLADKINFLLNNKTVAVEMGRKGREIVAQKFTEERHVNHLEEIFTKTLDSVNNN